MGTTSLRPSLQSIGKRLDPCFGGRLVGTTREPIAQRVCVRCLDPCFGGCLVGTD